MKRLIEIQQRLKAPKGQRNSFGNYNYRSAEDILEAVKPLLAEQKVALILKDHIMLVDDRFYICATASLYGEDGKEIIQTTASAREPIAKKGMDESQITGMASSYARKYALNGLFCIDDTKDADTMDNRDSGSPAKITDKQKQDLVALGANIPELCKYFQVENVDDLSYVQARQAINAKKKQGA